jgi:hypothetical protein
METRLQLSGNWLASRLGANTSVAPTADDQRVLDIATSKLQQVSASTVDIQLANTSWLVLKDRVDEYSNMVAVVQLAQDDLGAVANFLAQIQQGYDALSGMTEGSQAQTDQIIDITQLELALSEFIGRRSVTMSDISLFYSPSEGFDKTAFKAIDSDASTPSTDTDTFAMLEVDLAEVLNSTHEARTCPICQSMAASQEANVDEPAFDNLAVSAPILDEAAATNSSNVTGATTKSASTASYVEALRSGAIWDLSAGETLSYSYYTGAVSYGSYAGTTYNAPLGATAISAQNQAYLDQAFAAWDLASAFTLEKVTESGTAVGELRSAYTTRTYASAGSAAYAYYPNSGITGGDIWYIDDQATNLDFTPGGYGYYTALHEIGHAIGLSHSFGGSSSGATLSAADDIARNTVMTYTQYDRNQYWVQNGSSISARYFYATTPGLYDVAAMEHMYGTNASSNNTNTIHQFANWTAASPLYFQTIVDTGGADTFDASAQVRSSTINLTPGTFSSLGLFTEAAQEAYWATVLGGAIDIPSTSISSGSGTGLASRTALYTGADNVGIAYSATIENAIGGSAADTITGNTANNALKGGLGNDTMDGGAGSDTAVFSGAKADYTITGLGTTSITVVDNNTADGNDGTDTLSNFEFLEFSDLTVTTSDATGATTTASGAGAIATATAGAATSSSSSSSSTSTASSSGGGGGGGGGFSGDMSTEMGQRNFARFQAYQAQKRAEEWLAANPELAQAHLLSVQTAPQSKSAVEQSTVMKVAMSAVAQQSQTVAEIARNLYAQANILSLPSSNVADVINSTTMAKSVTAETADALVQQQNKSSLAVVSKQEVAYLLS